MYCGLASILIYSITVGIYMYVTLPLELAYFQEQNLVPNQDHEQMIVRSVKPNTHSFKGSDRQLSQ
jgi:hypothetical protein